MSTYRPYGSRKDAVCEGDELCCQPVHAKGLCRAHYNAQYHKAVRGECSVSWCGQNRHRRELCIRHYLRWKKYGDPLDGGPIRRSRGTGLGKWYYAEQRRMASTMVVQLTGVDAQYVKIIRRDPCVYCGMPTAHIDHIQAVARGGESGWINLAPTCASCNLRKSTKTVLEFMLERLAA